MSMHLYKFCQEMMQNKERYRAAAIADAWWRQDARAGRSCSASRPSSTMDTSTPTPKFQYHDVDSATPPNVPLPQSKVQLQAACRLKKALQGNGRVEEKAGEEKKAQVDEAMPENGECEAEEKPEMCADPDAEGLPDPAHHILSDLVMGEPKKKRKPNDGPLEAPYRRYMEAKKQEGVSFHEAQRGWKTSQERKQVVDQMSEAERKRRRY